MSSMGSNAVNVIDLKTMSFSAVIPAGGRPRPYVISADGKTMYVAVSYLHGFDIVNIAEKKVLERVEMPPQHTGPPRPRKFETPDTLTHGLALTPDDKELWVTSLLDDCIYIYDLQTRNLPGACTPEMDRTGSCFLPMENMAASAIRTATMSLSSTSGTAGARSSQDRGRGTEAWSSDAAPQVQKAGAAWPV